MKPNFIGIAELGMKIVNQKGPKRNKVSYNLHVLFSVIDHYLTAQCLDTGTYSRLDIKEAIKNSDKKKAGVLAKAVFEEIFNIHLDDISNHFISCHKKEITYPFSHISEQYWKSFRKIRSERDNYSFNKFHGFSTSGIEPFIDLPRKLENAISEIQSELLVSSFKESFIKIIDDIRDKAA